LNKIDSFSLKYDLSEYGEAFIDFLLDKNPQEITNIDKIISVCKKIETDFKGKKRKTGEDYVCHLYEVARFYIELPSQKISGKEVIVALLHDTIEDI